MTANYIIEKQYSDLISMARPFLADPYLIKKAINNQTELINSCIGCNQACLDHIFKAKKASCLVNPQAGHELDLIITPVKKEKIQNIAVIGAGPGKLRYVTCLHSFVCD